MADAAIEFLLQNLKELLIYNVSLLGNAKNEVEALRSEVELLKAVIKDLSDDTDPSHEQKALLNNVRKAVEKAEDEVDDFIIEKAKLNSRGAMRRLLHPFDYASIRQIAMEIGKIRQAADKMSQRKADEWILPKRSNHTASGITKRPVVEEEHVVGFDESANEIISFLRGDPEGLDVIGIVGMPGVGKTTLANKVYKDESIDYEFMYRAWAYVSRDCRVEDVFLSILRQLGDERENYHKMSSPELANKVKQCLTSKKYLIVLDDVWTFETWDALRVAFPYNNKHSRILLTTRNNLIAQYANRNGEPYKMKFLTESESWELLKRRVFGKSDGPEELEHIGKHIARECGGLPLAIVIISGNLLPKRLIKAWWEKVAERVSAFVIKDDKWLFDVVSHTYNSLPYNLQLCFLYCGFIQRGPLPVSKLIRLWIAEGFIRDELTLGLENMARAYLDELVDMNLLIPISRRSNGEVRTCQIHDILRDFCKREADTQGFYHDIRMSNLGLSSNYRRICVDSNAFKWVSRNSAAGLVRTILTSSDNRDILEPKEAEMLTSSKNRDILEPTEAKMLKAFRKIRILEASTIKFLRFPKELQELVLLRFLAFSCDFKSIPSSISNLWNLQTLIIITAPSVIQFPNEIWKLHQLSHLETNASALLPEPEPPISTSEIVHKNMQNLSKIAPESCTEEVFSRVSNVKKLGIQGKLDLSSSESKLIDNLGILEQLTNFKLLNDFTSQSIVQNLSRKFSNVVTRLKKLTISSTFLGWESMSILGKLEMLEVLKAKDNAFIGEEWNANCGIFPSLKLLCIDTTDLKVWEASNEQFLKLTSLVLKNCKELEAVPTLLADLHSFQNLDVYNCSSLVAQSAREIYFKRSEMQNNIKRQSLKFTVYPPDM